ncbi:MAG: ABC transporter permease [Solirubrobacterales bacterium]
MESGLIHSAEPALHRPSRAIRRMREDMRVVLPVAWTLFVRGQQATYRQSILRYVWLVVPLVATTIVWVFLDDSGVLGIESTGTPYPVYVASGTMLWQIFVDGLNAPLRKLNGAREVLAKTRVPHETWIIAGMLDALLAALIRGLLIIVLLIAYGIGAEPSMLLVVPGTFALLLLGMAIGLALAPIGLLYQDIGQALTILVGFWFFLTPVVYVTPSAGGAATWIVHLNPVTPLLVTTRSWLVGSGDVMPTAMAVVTSLAACGLGLAWLAYRVSTPHLVARL